MTQQQLIDDVNKLGDALSGELGPVALERARDGIHQVYMAGYRDGAQWAFNKGVIYGRTGVVTDDDGNVIEPE